MGSKFTDPGERTAALRQGLSTWVPVLGSRRHGGNQKIVLPLRSEDDGGLHREAVSLAQSKLNAATSDYWCYQFYGNRCRHSRLCSCSTRVELSEPNFISRDTLTKSFLN